MRTYWLYDGERVIGSARAADHMAHTDIIKHVLASHDRVPFSYPGEAPFEYRLRLARAEVRI